MFGIFGLAIPIGIIVAIVLWVRRSRPAEPAAEQADKQPEVPRRISLLTEAVGYIGTILVLAGAASAIGQQWSDIGKPVRLAILVVATLVFLVLGFLTRTSTEPAFRRLAGVTWAVSVAAFAGSVAVINQFFDTDGETAFVTIATSATAYAALLWWANQYAIQHMVLFAGVLVSAGSILTWSIHDPQVWLVCMTVWAIAVVWTALGWSRRISPWWVAVPLGLFVAVIAPAYLSNESARFALGIGTAAAVMGLSVLAKFTPGLGLGTVAMLSYVIGAVVYYFGDSLGVPAALAITGVLILVAAVVVARVLPVMRRKPPSQAPPSQAPPSQAPHERRAA